MYELYFVKLSFTAITGAGWKRRNGDVTVNFRSSPAMHDAYMHLCINFWNTTEAAPPICFFVLEHLKL